MTFLNPADAVRIAQASRTRKEETAKRLRYYFDEQGDETLRYLRKCLLHRFRCHRHFLLQNDLPRFIQNAVARPAIAEVHTNRELVSFENHVSIYSNSASLFHSRSPFLCFEHV